MADRSFWIGVVSRSHVQLGVRGGFMQLSHGKSAPLQKLRAGDGLVMYSPRTSYPDGDVLQSFTAIGVVASSEIYQVEMTPEFKPYRVDVEFLECHEAPNKPLIDSLTFIKDKAHWGAAFRFGQLRIPAEDFDRIAQAMGCSALHFHQAYAGDAIPPWDIGRPQPALLEAERRGWVAGAVLDAGCGTGEHALHFAAAGYDVVGVDIVPAAIDRALAKAAERKLPTAPRFVVADLLHQPQALAGRSFRTVVDMGFFHTLSDEERTAWRGVLADILEPGGSYVMVCFSELVPAGFGPRRISEADIRETFAVDAGFAVMDLERTGIQSDRGGGAIEIPGWLARIERIASRP